MTSKINNITLGGLRVFGRSDYGINFEGWVTDEDTFEELRELFALASTSSSVQVIRGRRPKGIDHTEDSILTVYCEFSTQAIHKLKDGYYLLTGWSEGTDARRPVFIFRASMVYLGSSSYYQEVIKVMSLEALANDWSI